MTWCQRVSSCQPVGTRDANQSYEGKNSACSSGLRITMAGVGAGCCGCARGCTVGPDYKRPEIAVPSELLLFWESNGKVPSRHEGCSNTERLRQRARFTSITGVRYPWWHYRHWR